MRYAYTARHIVEIDIPVEDALRVPDARTVALDVLEGLVDEAHILQVSARWHADYGEEIDGFRVTVSVSPNLPDAVSLGEIISERNRRVERKRKAKADRYVGDSF